MQLPLGNAPQSNPLEEKAHEDKGQDSDEEDPGDCSGADLATLEKATDLFREKLLPDPQLPSPLVLKPSVAWALPVLGPLLGIRALLLLASCLIRFLKQQKSSIAKSHCQLGSDSVPNRPQHKG